jgi:hypothetical protein
MKILKVVAGIAVALALLVLGGWFYWSQIRNPAVMQELIDDPNGERAGIVMVLNLPSGRSLPVNYWRDGDFVYAAADGRWGAELMGDPAPVTVVVRGETLQGSGRAVLDDPEYTKRVFASLRPDAVEGFGTLIEIRVGESR